MFWASNGFENSFHTRTNQLRFMLNIQKSEKAISSFIFSDLKLAKVIFLRSWLIFLVILWKMYFIQPEKEIWEKI